MGFIYENNVNIGMYREFPNVGLDEFSGLEVIQVDPSTIFEANALLPATPLASLISVGGLDLFPRSLQ